jgi:hypothetical protein
MVDVPEVNQAEEQEQEQEQEQEFVAKEEDYSKQPVNWLEDFEIPMKRFTISYIVARKVIYNSQEVGEEEGEQALQPEHKQEYFEESITCMSTNNQMTKMIAHRNWRRRRIAMSCSPCRSRKRGQSSQLISQIGRKIIVLRL